MRVLPWEVSRTHGVNLLNAVETRFTVKENFSTKRNLRGKSSHYEKFSFNRSVIMGMLDLMDEGENFGKVCAILELYS